MIYTYILFAVLCVAEAYLEQIVIILKNPALNNYDHLNREEHRRSAIYYFVLIGYALGNEFIGKPWQPRFIWLIPAVGLCLMIIRRMFFDGGLKLFRDRGLVKIEGTGTVDNFMRGIFGVNGGIKELLLLSLLLTGLIYVTL